MPAPVSGAGGILLQSIPMKKPFLILQLRPEDETSDNEFEAFLKFGGLEKERVRRIRVEKEGIPELNLDEYSGIIVGGSPFDVGKPEAEKSDKQKSVEQDFKKLLDEVVKRDFPFLGACSGCGLLGLYCNTAISNKYAEPVGGVDVFVTEEGKIDPLLKGLPRQFRALVGHKEACEGAPEGAALLAYSHTCPVQMFRIGKNVYATQFHPEADAEGFTVRINVYKHHGYFPPEDAEKLIAAVQNEDTPAPKRILRRFVERYQT